LLLLFTPSSEWLRTGCNGSLSSRPCHGGKIGGNFVEKAGDVEEDPEHYKDRISLPGSSYWLVRTRSSQHLQLLQ
jgi:hypothetical protein